MEHKLGIFLIAYVIALIGIQFFVHLFDGDSDIEVVIFLSFLFAAGCALV
jgi:hypothetical protein